ncbi:MAG: cation diffusion facilitator family transporter [Nitrospinota bacterium]|nr:cation diffusion facilitator family transporter [Nitrospinota bacterium]
MTTGDKEKTDERVRETKTITLVGSAVNILLTAVKMAAGMMAGSAALVADAFHSLTDLITDAMVYVSINIAAKEADEDHPYGHGRAETIAATAIGATLILVGLLLLMDLGKKLVSGVVGVPQWPALAAALLSIVAKEALYHYTVIVGRRHDNQAIIANAWHHRSDSISSVAALIGIGGAMAGFPMLDPLAAVIVVFMITKVGMEIAWEALGDLMDTSLSAEKMEELGKEILRTQGVVSYHELRTRKLGGDLFVDAHIEVRPDISVSEAHNIAETVRHNLKKRLGATDALVHIDAEDDMQYKIIRQSRAEVEREVAKYVSSTAGVRGYSQVVIHYLGGETVVELVVEVEDGATVGEAKQIAIAMKKGLEDGKMIHKVVIRGKLTDNTIN